MLHTMWLLRARVCKMSFLALKVLFPLVFLRLPCLGPERESSFVRWLRVICSKMDGSFVNFHNLWNDVIPTRWQGLTWSNAVLAAPHAQKAYTKVSLDSDLSDRRQKLRWSCVSSPLPSSCVTVAWASKDQKPHWTRSALSVQVDAALCRPFSIY